MSFPAGAFRRPTLNSRNTVAPSRFNSSGFSSRSSEKAAMIERDLNVWHDRSPTMHSARRTLHDIARDSRRLGRDRFAWSNFERDLSAVRLRLQSGEYRDTDFADRNVFDI